LKGDILQEDLNLTCEQGFLLRKLAGEEEEAVEG
jgi:hypothetical protein